MPSAAILYHFFHPDDVVSARHFSEFAEELAKRGWSVTVLTSNRYCRYRGRTISLPEEEWKGIRIFRSWRPDWNQARTIPRILNSLWMMASWAWQLWKRKKTDAIIVGSDPQFSQLLFPLLGLLRRSSLRVYWCYDLYPEAILADGATGLTRRLARRMVPVVKATYRYLDLVADIGPCMKKRFSSYPLKSRPETLTPWALVEPREIPPADPEYRARVFGDARLALLYSGNLGKAHDFSLFLRLARTLYPLDPKIIFCFACRGNRAQELKAAIQPGDRNIRILPFAEEGELAQRLLAADIHLISLQEGWEGIVVPSKFFGSLAVGRPVIYAGPEGSDIAEWIHEFNVGRVLTDKTVIEVGQEILRLAQDPEQMREWGRNAHRAYQHHFTKEKVMDQWDTLLRSLLPAANGLGSPGKSLLPGMK